MTSKKQFIFDPAKNEKLKKERGISFQEIIDSILGGNMIQVLEHHNPKKYPNQCIYVIQIEDYIYMVPVEQKEDKIYLKTIYPSRKATKFYLNK